jgi:hypothetical protein
VQGIGGPTPILVLVLVLELVPGPVPVLDLVVVVEMVLELVLARAPAIPATCLLPYPTPPLMSTRQPRC